MTGKTGESSTEVGGAERWLIAILPYLKTAEPVTLRGIAFRPCGQTNGLIQPQSEDLHTLLAMFAVRDPSAIYACVSLHGADWGRAWRALRTAHSFIAYLYASPDARTGQPFLPTEATCIYVFERNDMVPQSLAAWPEKQPTDDADQSAAFVSGYSGLLNWRYYLTVAQGSRIYPQVHHQGFNISQDLAWDCRRYFESPGAWAIEKLVRSARSENPEREARVFTAIDWYNRSCGDDLEEDVALVNLAVAFECLLGLPEGERLTQRFKESVIALLGNVPRLDSWLHQFYTARSKIVHTGSWSHFLFYPVDAVRAKAILGGKTTEQPYRPLTAYGRRVFRLCLAALLSGATLAEESNLRALFEHNQERLERICLTLDDGLKDVADRFAHAAEDILQLHHEPLDAAGLVSPDTALAAGRRVVQAFIELSLDLPDPVRGLADEILSQQRSSARDESKKYEQLSDLIPRHWGIIGDSYTLQDLDIEAPSILLHMAKYLSSLQYWDVWRKLDL